ncbi:hypothetical protein SD81_014620 [Tolypothrix campylonemoides VB511288]|nr:hypothetical protein SD81_040430 [Tolypothrix campylonemoides VB511288]KAB8313885.1 hypothetical protein SD81_040665 [Tolypothrix campylonemoides VB511288]KAB8318676.1 hypothetical protein SD81_014620 [Tolypothrix campylonemoides VB511288]
MSSKKALKQDLRGGRRENAGRKPIWKNKETITIRVPKLIATQVLELAHRLDSGENIELDTESKTSKINEIITKSNLTTQEKEYDFVMDSNLEETEIITKSITTSNLLNDEIITKSKTSITRAVEVAKKILKHKKSARISLAKLISKLYSLTVSPEDLK